MCPWVLKLSNRWPLSCTTWQLHLHRHPQRETRWRNRPCNCVLEASGDRRCWWWHLLKQFYEHWVDLMSPLELTWFDSTSVKLNFKLRQLVACRPTLARLRTQSVSPGSTSSGGHGLTTRCPSKTISWDVLQWNTYNIHVLRCMY